MSQGKTFYVRICILTMISDVKCDIPSAHRQIPLVKSPAKKHAQWVGDVKERQVKRLFGNRDERFGGIGKERKRNKELIG